MKASLRWIREFAAIPDDAGDVASALESLGHEVESIDHLEPQFRGIVVGRVARLRPHPDADRIRLATVDVGGETTEVVCGAWNFDVGDVVPFSPPGAVLAGGFEVGVRAIRGIDSPGMICSERELGLSDEHEGILVLAGETPIGSDFADLVPLPDTVFDLSITTNRPDAMSMIGLARDLAAYYRVPLVVPDPAPVESGAPSAVDIVIDDEVGCPRYVAREVRGVSIGPSPLWMRVRLDAVGLRPINNVVDISNYVLMEMGHPTHAFDRHRLGDTVVIRRARHGEKLRTLDGVDRELIGGDDLVIADAERAVAFAGVMGGEDTEVGEDTEDVLVESAYFHPPSVMLTSKRHALRTDASARFERGMDPNAARRAADRVAELIAELAGGEVAAGAVDAYPRPIEPQVMTLEAARVGRLLGVEFDAAESAELLERLGFTVTVGDGVLTVTVPTRRPDVERSVDLVEEIARLHGYDNIPETIAIGAGGGIPLREHRYRKLREVMVGAGYSETMSLGFIGEPAMEALRLDDDDPRRRAIRVLNPLRDEEALLRTTLLPGLLGAVGRNLARGLADPALFETGKVFRGGGLENIPDQPDMLAFAVTGVSGGGWHGGGRPVDAHDATGVFHLIARAMEAVRPELRSVTTSGFHPGRAAEALVAGEVIGVVGEIHPDTAASFGISGRVAAGELLLEPLLADPGLWGFRPPSPYPPVIFDLAFELDAAAPAAALLEVVREAAGTLLEDVSVFDVFAGAPLPDDKKSLAIRLRLRSPERTLTDEEAAPVRKAVAAAVADRLGGILRGAGT